VSSSKGASGSTVRGKIPKSGVRGRGFFVARAKIRVVGAGVNWIIVGVVKGGVELVFASGEGGAS
jgi:hypothetical protein